MAAGNIRGVTPVMAVPTLQEGLDFFVGLLGFTVLFEGGDYAYVARDGAGVRLMAHAITDGAAPGNRRYGIYFDVEDVDALAAEWHVGVLGLNGRAVHGPADKPYGQRELCIEGPDGNMVVFGQDMAGR